MIYWLFEFCTACVIHKPIQSSILSHMLQIVLSLWISSVVEAIYTPSFGVLSHNGSTVYYTDQNRDTHIFILLQEIISAEEPKWLYRLFLTSTEYVFRFIVPVFHHIYLNIAGIFNVCGQICVIIHDKT